MKSFGMVDAIVISVYFAAMLALGVLVSRANRSARDYFAGGNRIPWWASGMTMYMANFSAWTFSGAAGFVYATGGFSILYFALWPVAYAIGTRLTAVQWRRTRSVSPVEFMHERFTPVTRQVFSWVLGTNFLLTAGVQLAAVCTLLAPLLGVDIRALAVMTGAVILLYTFFGGIWAVAVTDVVQGVLLLSITVVVVVLSILHAGGIESILAAAPAFSMTHEYNGVHYDGNWLISIVLIMSLGVASGQAQRFYSVRDERAARRTGYFAAALFCTAPLLFGIPPLAARVFWPDLSAEPFFSASDGGTPGDLVYLGVVLRVLPQGLLGVFAAAMLAATMSTLSSVYNMLSSIAARDVYLGVFRRNAGDADVLRAGRIASVVIGAVVVVLALTFVSSTSGIFNIMQALYTLLNVPVIVPVVGGLLFRRPSRHAALASVLAGLAVGLLARYMLGWSIGPQVYLQLVATAAVFLSTGWRVRIRPELAAFFTRLDTPVDVGNEVTAGASAATPVSIAGATVIAIAAVLLLLLVGAYDDVQRLTILAVSLLLAACGALLVVASRAEPG